MTLRLYATAVIGAGTDAAPFTSCLDEYGVAWGMRGDCRIARGLFYVHANPTAEQLAAMAGDSRIVEVAPDDPEVMAALAEAI